MKINQLKAGVIISYVSMFLGNLISIVYTPVMLRLLGQSEYGLYNLVVSVVGYLGLLSFGFGSAYVRYYSIYKVKNDDKNIARLNGMFLTVFFIIGFVALLAGSVLVMNTENMFRAKLSMAEIAKTKILMSILVFNIAVSFPFSVFDSYITANEQYFFQRILNMVKTIVSPFVVLPLLLLGYRSVAMVVVLTCVNIAVGIANIVFCYKKLHIQVDFKNFDLSLLKEIALFSSFIFINIVSDQINWNVDKFLLGIFQGTVAIAIYGVASQLNNYYLSFSTSISSVFIPKINQMVAQSDDNKELTYLFTKVGRIQFIILSLIMTGLIFFGQPFINNIWAGKNYQDSYAIALVLMIPVTIPGIQNLGIEIQRAKNLHKFRSVVYLFIAIANLLLSIPLCKLYSGLGCAIGTAIALFIGNGLLMNIYYHKKVKLDMKYFWIQILKFIPALILPSIFGILITRFVDLNRTTNLLLFGILYIAVFCASMWFSGMNPYEKELFRQPMQKIWKKLRPTKA